MRHHFLIAACCAALVATPASPRSAPQTGTPASIQALLGCRSITEAAQRLACYDRASGTVAEAIGRKDLVVIDKARATQAKRSLFGFSIPDFGGLFGGSDTDVKQIESTVASIGHNADGGWVIGLSDGSTWSQTDDAMLGLPPRRGDKVVVKRGMLGSFFLELGKQPGFKAKRIG